MRNGEEVGLNISKTSVRIYMRLIASRRRWKVMANAIDHSDNVSSGGSKIERLGSIWMQMFIHRNDSLAANDDYMHFYIQLLSTH